jgi:hypothetical protein
MPVKPWINNYGQQRNSNSPAVDDLYKSPNVFINGVPAVLYARALGDSGGYQGIASVPSPAIKIDKAKQAELNAATQNYVNNPGQFYNEAASADGVKGNYAGTPDDDSTAPGLIAGTTSTDLTSFLSDRLHEASMGKWRETGQGGNPSNPNITNIWTNLGYPAKGAWASDQTAWCMGFVNFALKGTGYRYVQTASAQALPSDPGRWNATQVPKDQAQPGDIAFWSYRHVNFVYTAKNGKYTFVGGNQTPSGGKNNPSDGDVTISYPGGASASTPTWVSCWRPNKS